MRFRLTYRGRLMTGNSRHAKANKHEIRRQLHPQLAELWKLTPGLPSNLPQWFPQEVGEFNFIPLAVASQKMVAEIDLLFLRPEPRGRLVAGGDLDNRLKTLFDALRMPHTVDELPRNAAPSEDESPFYCLLADDSLISRIAVDTDRLLDGDAGPSTVLLVMDIRVYTTNVTWELTGSPLALP